MRILPPQLSVQAQLFEAAGPRADLARLERQLSSGLREGSYVGLGADSGALIGFESMRSRMEAYAVAAQQAEDHFAQQELWLQRAGEELVHVRTAIIQFAELRSGSHAEAAADRLQLAAEQLEAAEWQGAALFDRRSFAAGPELRLVSESISDIAAGLRDLAGRIRASGPAIPAENAGALVAEADLLAESILARQGSVGEQQRNAAAAVREARHSADEFAILADRTNGVDPAAALSELSLTQASLQASYSVVAKIQSLSLTQFL